MTEARLEERTGEESTPDEEMCVLAVTSFRPAEVEHSVSHMSSKAVMVQIEPRTDRVRHIVDCYKQIQDAISTHEPTVILLDCFETMGIVVTLLARRHGIPVVARLVGDRWQAYEGVSLGDIRSVSAAIRYGVHRGCFTLNSLTFAHVSGFVTVSTALGAVVTSRTGIRQEAHGFVPVPLTKDTLQEGSSRRGRTAHGIDEENIILTVTNLKYREKYDGLLTVVDELEPLLRENSTLGFVIAGSGRFLASLETVLDERFESDVRGRIYTPGYVDSISDLYAAADVFVYVSYRDGYPNAVLEAQTAELPVVANAAHGMRDQIVDGESGFLIDPGERGQLRTRVQSLLENPSLRQQIGTRARERVLAENSPEVVSQQLERTLKNIVLSV